VPLLYEEKPYGVLGIAKCLGTDMTPLRKRVGKTARRIRKGERGPSAEGKRPNRGGGRGNEK